MDFPYIPFVDLRETEEQNELESGVAEGEEAAGNQGAEAEEVQSGDVVVEVAAVEAKKPQPQTLLPQLNQ